MITVTLHCDDCTASAEAEYPSSIDPYAYHDAPMDGVQFVEPQGWWFSATGYRQLKDLVALCPVHNTHERRLQARGY